MSNAKSIVEGVAYQALVDTITVVPVFQDVPADFLGDMVVIGDLKSRRFQTKVASPDRYVTVSIASIVTAEERAPLLNLQSLIEDALDGQSFESDGWAIEFSFEEDDAVLGEDGVTYSGITNFSALAIAP